jgi:hypothetical protein
MLTAVFISLVFALTIIAYPTDFTRVVFQLKKGSVSFVPSLILWMSVFLIALLVSAGVFHLIALLLRGRGSYLGMACGLSFAFFPLVLFAPLGLLRALLGFSGIILYDIGTVAIFFWVLILIIIAIRQNYGFTIGRAIATYFIPGAVVFITLIVAAAITLVL